MAATHKLKAVHFVKISRGPAFFLCKDLFTSNNTLEEGWEKLLKTFHSLLTTHANADGKRLAQAAKDGVVRLAREVAETLATLELSLPAIAFDRMLHIMLHVPRAIQRWNAARNFWAFSMERYNTRTHVHYFVRIATDSALFRARIRYVGFITNFVRQRHRAAASCAFSYTRLSFVRGMPSDIRERLLHVEHDHTSNTLIASAEDFMSRYGKGARGGDEVSIKPTWKNSRALQDRNKNMFVHFLNAQFANRAVCRRYGGELGDAVEFRSMLSGVYINGYSSPWKIGSACLYVCEGVYCVGIVLSMLYRAGTSQNMLAFQIARHQIIANEVVGKNIMFTVSVEASPGAIDLVLWKAILFRCIMLKTGGHTTALVVNSTKSEDAGSESIQFAEL